MARACSYLVLNALPVCLMCFNEQNAASKILQCYLFLPHTYSVCNSIHLITHLQTTKHNKDMWLCSFNTENMYTNIQNNTMNIISNILKMTQKSTKISKKKHYTYYSDGTRLFSVWLTVLQTNRWLSHTYIHLHFRIFISEICTEYETCHKLTNNNIHLYNSNMPCHNNKQT
jgi:hypothetical protein